MMPEKNPNRYSIGIEFVALLYSFSCSVRKIFYNTFVYDSLQFNEAFDKLMEWLEESENSLDSELDIANDPDKIKTQLTTHKVSFMFEVQKKIRDKMYYLHLISHNASLRVRRLAEV